jgi:AraC-like DNA-binding protein
MRPGLREYWQNDISKGFLTAEPRRHNNGYSAMDKKLLLKALQVIEENMSETDFSAEKLRKEIGISRSHLHRKLKSLTNKSTTGFIRSIRLYRAAELLNQRVATVSEIAYDTGFNNLSYFTCCFKKEYGVVPSAYFKNSKSIKGQSFSISGFFSI